MTAVVVKTGTFTIADSDITSGEDDVIYKCTGTFDITIPSSGVTTGNVFAIMSTDGLQSFVTTGASVAPPKDRKVELFGKNASVLISCLSSGGYKIDGDLAFTYMQETSVIFDYEVTGSAEQTIDIPTALLGKEHYEFILYTGAATNTAVTEFTYVYINGDTTSGNYAYSRQGASVAQASGSEMGVYNNPSSIKGSLYVADGQFFLTSMNARGNTTTTINTFIHTVLNHTTTMNSIDDVQFTTSDTNGFPVGARLVVIDPTLAIAPNPGSTVIYEHEVTTATDTLDIPASALGKDKYQYELTVVAGNVNQAIVKLYVNGETADTNYNGERLYSYVGSSAGESFTYPHLSFINPASNNTKSLCTGDIGIVGSRFFGSGRESKYTTAGGSNAELDITAQVNHVTSMDTFTGLRFSATEADTFGVGTKIRIIDSTLTNAVDHGSTVIYDYEVTGSAQQTLDVPTSLLGKEHYEFILYTGAATAFATTFTYIFINNDNTSGNYSYNRQGASVAQGSGSEMGVYNYESSVRGSIHVADGQFFLTSANARGDTATQIKAFSHVVNNHTTTMNSIDDVQFTTSDTNGFPVGARLVVIDPTLANAANPASRVTQQVRTKLYEEELTVDGVFDVSNISQDYDDLEVEVFLRGANNADYDYVNVYYNNDLTDTNYFTGYADVTSGTQYSGIENKPRLGTITGDTATANFRTVLQFMVHKYTDPDWYTATRGFTNAYRSSGTYEDHYTVSTWKSTAAVNRIKVDGQITSNLKAGSKIVIYGIREELVGTSVSAVQTGVVGEAYAEHNTYTTVTATIPWDDTIPQSGEGAALLSLNYTPKYADSYLMIDAVVQATVEGERLALMAFRDSDADAFAVNVLHNTTETWAPLRLQKRIKSNSTAQTTIKFRVGLHAAGSAFLNGDTSARKLGGALTSSFSIREVRVA